MLAGATSLESAAPEVLEIIAGRLDWRAGLFWEPHENEPALHCAAHWDRTFQTGRQFFRPGANRSPSSMVAGCRDAFGAPEQPAWVTDLRRDSNFPRLNLAAEHGLRSAFAFPILLGERVHGVMEFFAEASRSRR